MKKEVKNLLSLHKKVLEKIRHIVKYQNFIFQH